MKLLDLADVLRTVVPVVEHRGKNKAGQFVSWQEMSRPNEYPSSGPTHIMNHHTASDTYIINDVNYCNVTSPIRPLANVLFDRFGTAHVCAAGPTNTNGAGHDWWGGGVPDDQMNNVAIGFEICNSGTGEPYPIAQQEAVLLANAACSYHYDIPAKYCRAHFEWAPDRKIDPFGPSLWSPNGGKWDMDQFRLSVAYKKTELYPTIPPVGPNPGKKDLMYLDTPIRIFDSRKWGAPFEPGVHSMPFTDFPQIPEEAVGVTLTVTAVTPSADGFVTLWSGLGSVPEASNLNFRAGQTIANTTATKVRTNRQGFGIYVSAKTHLIFDVIAWQ